MFPKGPVLNMGRNSVIKNINDTSKCFSPTPPSHHQTLPGRDTALITKKLKESLVRGSGEVTNEMGQRDNW
jgi:hypothetical protein